MTEERLPQDHAERLRALDPMQSFLVQAPAGSGKTELLTDRILALLPTVSRPEEIVAITFTRKAASEMHARVLEKLARGLEPEPEAPHARRSWTLARRALAHDAQQGWNLLRHPARLGVRTIDAFCAGLLRSMPWLSGMGGMPGIADDARLHYDKAAQATLALAEDEAFDAVRRLLAHLDMDLGAARDALSAMLGQRDQWLPLLRHGDDREALEAALHDTVAVELRALARVMPRGWAESLSGPARLACDNLTAEGLPNLLAPLADWDGAAFSSDPHSLACWRALAHLLLTKEGGLRSPRGVNKNLGFPAKCAYKAPFTAWLEEHGDVGTPAWVTRLDGVRGLPEPGFSDAQWDVLGAQLMTLRLAAAQLQLQFAEAGEVDFIEVSQRVQAALGRADDPGELLLRLDASIRHLLIDEFQDTSQAQIDLVGTLTSGWQDGDGRTLFLVGDPMQSIYRFRKAEVGLFLHVRDQGLGALRPTFLSLTDNFRSQAGVVAWVNDVFAQVLPAADDAVTGAIRYAPSAAFHAAMDGPALQFHAVWPDEQDPDPGADCVARLAREALAAHADSAHPVAVLVRARSHLGRLTRRLAREGIPSRAVELVPLARRECVADLVQLVRALSHPGDRLAWLAVLRSPLCGLTLDSLHALFGADHRLPVPVLMARALAEGEDGTQPARAVLAADEHARLARAASILLDEGNASGGVPFAAWVERIWRLLGGTGLYAGAGDVRDTESLLRLVERLAPYGGLDTDALDAAVARLFASSDADGPAVEIMTMHKSKGLQFDTVILYGLERAPRGDQPPLVRFEQSEGRVLLGPVKARAEKEHDPVSLFLARRERRRAEYEADRLLYVAATRARERLHLVAALTPGEDGGARAPGATSLLARLWPHLAAPQAPARMDGVAALAAGAPALRGEPLRRVAAHAVPAPLSAPLAPPAAAGDSLWESQAGHEASVGTLVHAWLAQIGRDGLDAWPAEHLAANLARMRRQLTRVGVPDGTADAAAQDVLDALQASVRHERGRWLLSQGHARREWPLLDLAGKVSVIDLALDTDAGWLVVDYKTSVPRQHESGEAFTARMRLRHAEQLRRYVAQVAALDARPVKAALYFPRADIWIEF